MKLRYNPTETFQKIKLPASKSISNRLLVLKQLYFPKLSLRNLSEANDTKVMQRLLDEFGKKQILEVEDAGTAARFITALAATAQDEHIIQGTERMHQRPMAALIEALRNLGTHIQCLEKEGFLPIHIKKGTPKTEEIEISAEESSQFFSALLMIAPAFDQPLQLKFKGKVHSAPYIKMTLSLMQNLGIPISFIEDGIQSNPFEPQKIKRSFHIENDWSSVAFFLEFLSFQEVGFTLNFEGLMARNTSVQGDAVLMNWAPLLGCKAIQDKTGITFIKQKSISKLPDILNFSDHPDLALPLITAWAAQQHVFVVTGIETLKHKESDRIKALEIELKKCGVIFTERGDEIHIDGSAFHLPKNISFSTYKDHRMAMSLGMLAFFGNIDIEDPEVVMKSFPSFWEQVSQIGIISE
jgi:3-phosphoshikimate 1-carboxyvinyltransferase